MSATLAPVRMLGRSGGLLKFAPGSSNGRSDIILPLDENASLFSDSSAVEFTLGILRWSHFLGDCTGNRSQRNRPPLLHHPLGFGDSR